MSETVVHISMRPVGSFAKQWAITREKCIGARTSPRIRGRAEATVGAIANAAKAKRACASQDRGNCANAATSGYVGNSFSKHGQSQREANSPGPDGAVIVSRDVVLEKLVGCLISEKEVTDIKDKSGA